VDSDALYWDPYDARFAANPHPIWKRMREESPVYYNEKHDFYAISKFADVERAFTDPASFSSSRGSILELIKANMEIPPGTLIFEDPPVHDIHRKLIARVFSPRRVGALEPKVRDYAVSCLEPLVGESRFDIIETLGAEMPMRVIGMLLGIPEQDQEGVRDRVDANLRTEAGQPMRVSENFIPTDMFGEYIDWRAEHPSDDIMTELLQAEFEDETGRVRRLTRDELLTYISVISGAGNETTGRLIGWTGKVLADHPDQRREIVEDRSLLPHAIEELLRFETPAPHAARYVAADVEIHGTTVPEGSIMMLLPASANHDDRRFPAGDTFDIHRKDGKPLTFGYGIHLCLGAALARLEGRVALDEVLNRFPTWDVDMGRARLAPTSTVRGWETLPVHTS